MVHELTRCAGSNDFDTVVNEAPGVHEIDNRRGVLVEQGASKLTEPSSNGARKFVAGDKGVPSERVRRGRVTRGRGAVEDFF